MREVVNESSYLSRRTEEDLASRKEHRNPNPIWIYISDLPWYLGASPPAWPSCVIEMTIGCLWTQSSRVP
jgi:hypothetical protein